MNEKNNKLEIISKKLTKSEFKKLKFLSIQIISLKDYKNINNVFVFFTKIVEKCKSIKEIEILLKHVQRYDLISLIDFPLESYTSKIRPYRLLLFNIFKNLDSENKRDLIFLSKIPPQEEEKLIDNEDLILYLENKFSNSYEFLVYLEKILDCISRLDIKSKICEFLENNTNFEENFSNDDDSDSIDDHYETYPGLCLIFNFDNFVCPKNKSYKFILNKRIGSNIDKDNLKELFQNHLQFTTLTYDNLNHEEFLKKLEEYSQTEENFNCFVCFILSHGSRASIFTSDYQTVGIKEICKHFNDSKCPLLKNKAKIFFICACQNDINVDSNPELIGEPDLTCGNDFSVNLASKFGSEAIRSRKEGTWFIQSLIDAFHTGAEYLSFSDLLTCIQNGVNQRSSEKHLQIPVTVTTLNKHLRFNYKN